jgi:transcriptional regulator GlxA family with amidase domain
LTESTRLPIGAVARQAGYAKPSKLLCAQRRAAGPPHVVRRLRMNTNVNQID